MPLSDLSIGDRMRLCPHDGYYVIDEIEEIVGCRDCGVRGHSAVPMFGEDERRCSHCREVKPLENFDRDRAMPKGRSYICKPCRSDSRSTA